MLCLPSPRLVALLRPSPLLPPLLPLRRPRLRPPLLLPAARYISESDPISELSSEPRNVSSTLCLRSVHQCVWSFLVWLQTFTPEEVGKHNTEKDCWVIVNGQVLDVTRSLNSSFTVVSA
jgi:hypothetical protein